MLSTSLWEPKSGTQNIAIILKSYDQLDIVVGFQKCKIRSFSLKALELQLVKLGVFLALPVFEPGSAGKPKKLTPV